MVESYSASLGCKSKVEVMEDELGCCTKCGMERRIDRCKKHPSVKLVISSGANYLTLMAFGNQVRLPSKKRSAVSLFLLPVPLHRLTNIISSPLFAGHNCSIVTWD